MTGQQLKNSILQLAIQGRLVAQDPADEPASVLLQRVRQEKQRLVKEGKLKKKDLTSTPITEEEKPFDIPETWEWCRMKEVISQTNAGKSPNCQNRPRKVDEWGVIKTTAVQDGYFLANENKVLPENFVVQEEQIVNCEDLLITRAGPRNRTGVVCVVNSPCDKLILSDKTVRLAYLRGMVDPYYLMHCLNSPTVHGMVEEAMVGMASSQVNISQDSMKEFRIPLPPLAEQRRIVARIEELMPLVEDYGKAQEELEALNAGLPEALKKSILQEAIQGRLVPQDANDEPASVLLARIRKEKEQLVKAGKLKKKDLTTTPITEEEKPFDIPETWEWCRLGDIISLSNGYAFRSSEYVPSGVRIIRITNVQDGYMVDPDPKFYPANADVDWEKYILHEGDMLMSLTGNVGRVAFLPKEMLPAALNQRVACIRRNSVYFDENYLFHYFLSPYFVEAIFASSKGMAQKNASTEWLKQHAFPLPPLSEQRRIVAKIETLFAAIDQMKALH